MINSKVLMAYGIKFKNYLSLIISTITFIFATALAGDLDEPTYFLIVT